MQILLDFGQKFSKAYDIKFLNRNNELEYAYQTSWGVSSRMIAALIMVHGDDDGLVIPPRIAPLQVRIVPIGEDKEITKVAENCKKALDKAGIIADIDLSEKSPGFKFAEAEVLGIPVRIEIGKRDLDNGVITLARRDTKEKYQISLKANLAEEVTKLMEAIQTNLYNKAKARRDKMTYVATNLDEFAKIMNKTPGFVHADWCGDPNCESKVKEIRGTKSRCILENEKLLTGKCVVCGKKAKHHVLWGIQY